LDCFTLEARIYDYKLVLSPINSDRARLHDPPSARPKGGDPEPIKMGFGRFGKRRGNTPLKRINKSVMNVGATPAE
jgi:hypothetical protein